MATHGWLGGEVTRWCRWETVGQDEAHGDRRRHDVSTPGRSQTLSNLLIIGHSLLPCKQQ